MNNTWLDNLGRVGLIATLAVVGSRGAIAQIVPDSTLGNENSVVVPINAQLEHIQGGALRGSNLFHSFQDFNVQNGHSAYFLNPALVENIFSRVTGSNVSEIFGTLGILGEANLYLINPNGIIFGENASLDIKGSFVATTASSLVFGDGSEYSALNPEIPGAIVNNVPIQISLQFEGEPATIINLGNLSTGESLTLAGGNLDLEGELVAGEDLTLTAEETVKIRDTENSRFIAAAGNNLLVQGNEGVDIFALNHAESGLFSGGDMILRSNNAVIGDAHYYGGGSFRIEELDGDLGKLESPNDPVIRAQGDVFMNGYQGASLHILAGGKVEIPQLVWITGADTVNGITETVILSDGSSIEIDGKNEPTLDIRAGVDASFIGSSGEIGNFLHLRPKIITDIPSSADISLGTVIFRDANQTNRFGGQVLLTNQYQPNSNVTGNIEVKQTLSGIAAIQSTEVNGGGNINIISREKIFIDGFLDASAYPISGTFNGNGGAIYLLANDNISLNPNTHLRSRGNLGGNITLKTDGDILADDILVESSSFNSNISSIQAKGGDIFIDSRSALFNNSTQVVSVTVGQADTGNITINVAENLRIQGDDNQGFRSTISSRVETTAVGNAGNVNINAKNLELLDGAEIASSTFGQGNGGQIIINVNDTVRFQGEDRLGFGSEVFSQVEFTGVGNGGQIKINTRNFELLDGAGISTSTYGQGNGGNIIINASNIIRFQGEDSLGFQSGVFSQVAPRGTGSGGNVRITTKTLELLDGAGIANSTLGQGNAGNITLNATDIIRIQGESQGKVSAVNSQVEATGVGNGGEVSITTKIFEVLDGASITVSTRGQGNAGNVTVNASNTVDIQGENSEGIPGGIFSQVQETGMGDGGAIKINTGSLSILDGAGLTANTQGRGNAGKIMIQATDAVRFHGISSQGIGSVIVSQVRATGQGNAGEIIIVANTFKLIDRAVISTTTIGQGSAGKIEITANQLNLIKGSQLQSSTASTFNAGNITLQIADRLNIEDNSDIFFSGIFANTELNSTGNGGKIDIQTNTLSLNNGAQISASTAGEGKAGNITVNAPTSIFLGGNSQLSVETSNAGKAGNITLTTPNLTVEELARITATATATATTQQQGGSITVNASQMNLAGIVGIFAETQGPVPAGTLTLQPDNNQNNLDINFQQGAQISASTSGSGTGGSLFVFAPDTIDISGDGSLAVETRSTGNAGNIEMRAANLNLSNGAKISASTSGEGQGGNIDLLIDNRIQLNDRSTGILASTAADSRGNGGNINIQTTYLNAADSVEIGVNSQGMGTGGDIDISANRIDLNNSQITAETLSTQGGNIGLTVRDILLMRHGSKISTTAGTAQAGGDGGNITINAENGFLVGPPGEDNDITANAFEGNGGNINITAQEIFGLKFRDSLTPLSDITASSELGLDGTVQLNTLGIDPNNGLTNLPEEQTDPEVRQGCSRGGENSSSFTVQGIGGAPDNPDDMLTGELDDEFISLDELETDGTIEKNEEESAIALPSESQTPIIFSCQ